MNQGPSVLNQAAILKTRARALAQEPPRAALAETFLEIIEFCLASETYGIEAMFVREIHPLKDFTPLPGVPSFVVGIANIRGQILSVVDLKKFFNLPDKGLGELNKVIILGNSRMEFGILADAILVTRSVLLDAIQAPPATVTGIGAEYVRGVTGERVVVIDAQKILDDERIIVNAVVAEHKSKSI
jgi:purine-binding chemotaxis protein CheW